MNCINQKNRGLYRKLLIIFMCITFFVPIIFSVFKVNGEEENETVIGNLYHFEKKSKYEIDENSSYIETTLDNTYGILSVSGNNLRKISADNEVHSYSVEGGYFSINYTYDDHYLTDDETKDHLISDNSKEVNGKKLSEKVGKGAILVEISKDRKTWVDAVENTNLFETTPVSTGALYTANDVQLLNGCYYRITIAYELSIKTKDSKFLFFINNSEYNTRKYAEVYEFYAIDNQASLISKPIKNTESKLGERKRVTDLSDYSKYETGNLAEDDPHQGWQMGSFYVGGYTGKQIIDGKNIFLKDTGDKVSLWFELSQPDLNKCNGIDGLYVESDNKGYDGNFEVGPTNFGRGTLLICKVDKDGKKSEPIVYEDFLTALSSPSADTKVSLFEEGDYEVALDYSLVKKNASFLILDMHAKYSIHFKFSIRNGNTVVFFKDTETQSELLYGNTTKNGILVDFANSNYLEVYVERSVLNGNVFDVRKNSVVNSMDTFTDEGVYRFTIRNTTTGQITEKVFYVGDNNLLEKYYQFRTQGYISDIEEPTVMDEQITDNEINKYEQMNEKTKGTTINIYIYFTIIPIFIIFAGVLLHNKKKNITTEIDTNKEDGK